MNAQDILRMIETVDPADTEKLDEIDARVECYLNDYDFIEITKDKKLRHFDKARGATMNLVNPPIGDLYGYTRSRDALKEIRPEGWYPQGAWYVPPDAIAGGVWNFILCREDDRNRVTEKRSMLYCRTEELAELHAIIQAIEWERNNAQP